MNRETKEKVDHAVRCNRCGHPLTQESQAFAHDGEHRHTFTNPSGVTYEIVLFRDVPGATTRGDPDAATTWFAGTAWTYAHCARCDGHVGWRYVFIDGIHEPQAFFGLICDSISRD